MLVYNTKLFGKRMKVTSLYVAQRQHRGVTWTWHPLFLALGLLPLINHLVIGGEHGWWCEAQGVDAVVADLSDKLDRMVVCPDGYGGGEGVLETRTQTVGNRGNDR